MDRELGKEIKDRLKRISFLSDNADSIEEKGYTKAYTPEELTKLKESLSEVAISINEIELEKKDIIEDYKFRLKPLNQDLKEILNGLKNKSEFVKERCYKFIDTDNREVGFYNENGDLIETRMAYSDEIQSTIQQITRRTGTNN